MMSVGVVDKVTDPAHIYKSTMYMKPDLVTIDFFPFDFLEVVLSL